MIADFLYKNPRILFLTILVIVMAGLSSLFVMPRLEDPVLGRRVALVSTVFPGANPQRVESLVTIPMEQRLSGISQIKQVRSNSQAGISNIVVELQDQVEDVDSVWALVRNRLADANLDLPETAYQPELHIIPLKAYAAIISVQSTDEAESNLLDVRQFARQLRSRLLTVSGTEQVDFFGNPGVEYIVDVTPNKLVKTGLSTAAIAAQIDSNRADQPAGQLRDAGEDLALQIESNADPIKRLSDVLISYAPGKVVPLSELGAIKKTVIAPPSSQAIINNRPAIVLGVMVSDDLRIDLWADQMEMTLRDFRAKFPERISVEQIFSQREHIDQRMLSLLQNLGMSVLGVMFIVLIMMGWRSMLVVAAALPLSALLVLAAMRALSIPIHQMSITGLIVALGLLIDNAIVIVEDVRSRIINGSTPSQAIKAGVRSLAIPLFGSTLTTALAFLPIATLPGPPGEFVGTIAISVILAISASFILAMTLIPALISVLQVPSSSRNFLTYGITSKRLRLIYELSLRVVFRFPLLGIVLSIILPVAGFMIANSLPEQFFPASDRAQIQIEVELPARESIEATQAVVNDIQAIVAEYSQVKRQHWFLGSSAPTFYYNVVPRRRGTPFYAQAFIDLEDSQDISLLVKNLQSGIDQSIASARVIVRQLEQGPPFDAPVELRVLGPDITKLKNLGSQLRLIFSETPNVIHTRSDLEETIPRLSLKIDDVAAKQNGMSRSQINGLLYTTLEGASAGTIFEDDEALPVRVRMQLEGDFKMERLLAMPLPSMQQRPTAIAPTGSPPRSEPALNPTTLASVTSTEVTSDVGAIVRIDGMRANEVKAYIESNVLPSTVIEDFNRRLDASSFELPAGYSLQFGGESEQRSHAVNELIANGFVLFSLILLTLVASFRSFRCAFILAAVGGLSIGLGPPALSIFGYPFGFMAIVGTMGLVGIAINDSIVVLAAIREDEAAAAGDIPRLVIVVVHATRHIIATTLTTIVGFLPLILSSGRFWPPLAMTVAGGVGGATFLALYFVPSLYLILYWRFNSQDIRH